MRRPLFGVCLCLVTIVVLWRIFVAVPQDTESEELSGEQIVVTGQVYQKNTNSIILTAVSINTIQNADDSQQTIPWKYNIICKWEDGEQLPRLGSSIRVQGVYYDFAKATNPGEFNADTYYRTLCISGKIKDVRLLGMSEEYSRLSEGLYALKTMWTNRLYQVFPQKDASILSAMLLGDKEGLDESVEELYRRNGIIHVISISGLHISILGMGIYNLLRRIGTPVWLAALAGGGVTVLYGFLTGMSVSAGRAIGMYLLHMLAKVLGKTYDMQTAFGVLVAITIIYNPEYIFHQGFLLSYGAVVGIAIVYPALFAGNEKELRRKCDLLARRGSVDPRFCLAKKFVKMLPALFGTLGVSISISLVTLPIQLWSFYEVPVYATFVNLLVLPFMNAVMILGLVVMLLPGSGLLGTGAVLIFSGCEQVCRWFDALPMRAWNPGRPESWQVVIYYACLLAAVVICRKRHRAGLQKCEGNERRKNSAPVLLVLGVLVLAIPEPAQNRITFLDVGQGDGIVVETASGQVYLFDCGSSSRTNVGEYVLLPYLKYRGIRRIDAVLVSHGDSDHVSGVKELLQSAAEEGIEIGQLVMSEMEADWGEEVLREVAENACGDEVLKDSLEMDDAVDCAYMSAGMEWQTESATFTCLHPQADCDWDGSDNEASMCFYVEFLNRKGQKTFSLLLTGDVEGEGEEALLTELRKRDITDVSVLKVAHHGSRNSSSLEFLEQIKPKLAVISCGRNNRYGHPHEETLKRLSVESAAIFTTPENGAITVEVDEEVKVYGFTG